jgi:hypothetical protein
MLVFKQLFTFLKHVVPFPTALLDVSEISISITVIKIMAPLNN